MSLDKVEAELLRFYYSLSLYIKPLSAPVALIKKPVNWFAVQINWVVSIWGQHWHLMVKQEIQQQWVWLIWIDFGWLFFKFWFWHNWIKTNFIKYTDCLNHNNIYLSVISTGGVFDLFPIWKTCEDSYSTAAVLTWSCCFLVWKLFGLLFVIRWI